MIRYRLIAASLLLACACASTPVRNVPAITQAELERRTQELMDSVIAAIKGRGRSTTPTMLSSLMRRDAI